MGMGMDQPVRQALYYNHNKVFMLPDEGLCLHNLQSFYKQPAPCLTILCREKQWSVTENDNVLVSDTGEKVVVSFFIYLDLNASIRRYGICFNQFNVKQLC